MTHIVPGTMFFLGCSLQDDNERHLHSPHFNIDENCLPIGVAVMKETICRLLNGRYDLPKEKKENWKEVIGYA